MLAIISPAKSLNTERTETMPAASKPQFLDQANELAKLMRHYSPSDLANLMKLSDKLSALNAARFEQWTPDHTDPELLPAVFAFNGDVYQGLEVSTLSEKSLHALNDRVRILSGLYGLLRPLDAMRPYRLEMGTKFNTGSIRSLPSYWQSTVTDALNADLDGGVLVNLASTEYSAAVNFAQIEGTVVSPVFKDKKNGDYKIISFYAKRARGLMARYLVEHNIDRIEGLLDFDTQGYRYAKALSTPEKPCFIRDPESL